VAQGLQDEDGADESLVLVALLKVAAVVAFEGVLFLWNRREVLVFLLRMR
jgi:hypothetical protein